MGGCLSICFSTFIVISWQNISQGLSCPSHFLSQVSLKPTSSLPQQQGENSRARGRLSTSILFFCPCCEDQDGSSGVASEGFVGTGDPAVLLLLLISVPTSPAGPSAPQERTAETLAPACWEQGRMVPSPVSTAGERQSKEPLRASLQQGREGRVNGARASGCGEAAQPRSAGLRLQRCSH